MPLLKLDARISIPASAVTATHLWYGCGRDLRRRCLVTYADELVHTFTHTILYIEVANATWCIVVARSSTSGWALWSSNERAIIATGTWNLKVAPNRIVYTVYRGDIMCWENGSAHFVARGHPCGVSHRRILYRDEHGIMRWQNGSLATGVDCLESNDAVQYQSSQYVLETQGLHDYVQPPDEPGIVIPALPHSLVYRKGEMYLKCESRAAVRIQVLLREDPTLAARVSKFV